MSETAISTAVETPAPAAAAAAANEEGALYRGQLPDLFRAHGLPVPTIFYLNKLHSMRAGPPVAFYWNERPMYYPTPTLAWMRERMVQKTKDALERRERRRRFQEVQNRVAERLRESKPRETQAA